MKPLKYTGITLLGLVLIFAVFLLVATLADYRPDEVTVLHESMPDAVSGASLELELVIWNIGYAGLDKDMDFFYDGGERVRPEKEQVEKNLQEITSYIRLSEPPEVWLLQEVDVRSRRSYLINQFERISEVLPEYHAFFGKNYQVFFVPLPVSNPMGRVHSGLATYSGYEPVKVTRHSFPGNYSWPMGIFMLDRCFLVGRYPVTDGYELLIINTHNSAYDDGRLREGQMEYLKEFLLAEYEKGNYIVVGGDWNQTPPGVVPDFTYNRFDTVNLQYIQADYLPGDWTWAFDPAVPTNRRVMKAYDPETSPTALIDFFLLSPNVELVEVSGVHLDFSHSDHNPVKVKVKLK